MSEKEILECSAIALMVGLIAGAALASEIAALPRGDETVILGCKGLLGLPIINVLTNAIVVLCIGMFLIFKEDPLRGVACLIAIAALGGADSCIVIFVF